MLMIAEKKTIVSQEFSTVIKMHFSNYRQVKIVEIKQDSKLEKKRIHFIQLSIF